MLIPIALGAAALAVLLVLVVLAATGEDPRWIGREPGKV
jgi:hypothetical protein